MNDEKHPSYSIGVSTGFLTRDVAKQLEKVFYRKAPEVFEYEVVDELVKNRKGRKATRQDMEKYFNPEKKSIVVYARDKETGEIVGVAAVVESYGNYRPPVGDVKKYHAPELYIWVAEDHRGKGLGTELTRKALEIAKMRGYKEVIANLNNGNYRKAVERLLYKVAKAEGYRKELMGHDPSDNGPVYRLYIPEA